MRKKSYSRALHVFLFLSVLTFCALAQVGCGAGDEEGEDSVLVAANLPLSGNLATYGKAVQEGARMALDSLRSDGSDSLRLSFAWQDNASDPSEAVSIMQQQMLSSPDLYVSGVKPQTMAVIDQISARGIPHFVWIFDQDINPGDASNNFRTWVSYKLEPQVYLDYAEEENAERVAVVYVQLPHTLEAYQQDLVPSLKQQGVEEVLVEAYDPGKRDFKDIATKLNNFSPDLIILNGFQSNLVGLIRALRPFNLIQNGNTIATYDMLDAANVLGPDELEGIRIVAPEFVTRPDRERVAKWTERFRERYGKKPLYTHAFAYDMVLIMNDAAKRLELPATSDAWIEALDNTDMQGVTGPLRLDEDGDLLTPLEVGVYRDGELVPDTTVSFVAASEQ